MFDELMGYRAALEPYVGDAVGFVHRALKEGRRVLLEGQLGSMKDPNLGICPMTTSSHTLAGVRHRGRRGASHGPYRYHHGH